MTWIVEDGKRIEGGLRAFYQPEQLITGMQVRIYKNNKRIAPAIIERVHRCWHDYRPIGFTDPNGKRWEQTRGREDVWGRYAPTHYIWTLTDDDQPVTPECDDGWKDRPRCCVHVKYRNGVKAVVHLCFVRPPDVLGLMAGL